MLFIKALLRFSEEWDCLIAFFLFDYRECVWQRSRDFFLEFLALFRFYSIIDKVGCFGALVTYWLLIGYIIRLPLKNHKENSLNADEAGKRYKVIVKVMYAASSTLLLPSFRLMRSALRTLSPTTRTIYHILGASQTFSKTIFACN